MDGKLRRHDDYGNILYGILGIYADYGLNDLIEGSNYNQKGKSGNDESRDVYMIRLGYKIFNQIQESGIYAGPDTRRGKIAISRINYKY